MSGLSTVVFADLSGSTALYENLGNERAAEVVTHLTQWIGDTIDAHGGRVVKKLGDGVLAIFLHADDCIVALADMMRQHQGRLDSWPLPMRMDISVGVAAGEVVHVAGDYYGDAVNVASRLCELAGPGEVWATELTTQQAGENSQVIYRRLGHVDIRGKAEPLALTQVEWREGQAEESMTMQAGLGSHFSAVDSVLGQIQFSWHGVDMSFTSAETPVHVGRANQVELCINDPRVSRLHARIDWRNGGFVLTDLSSFGTLVQFRGSPNPVRLRRDACNLHGAGKIALGATFNDPHGPVLNFQVAGGSVHLG